jgi:hypothetical protein
MGMFSLKKVILILSPSKGDDATDRGPPSPFDKLRMRADLS